MTIFNRRGITQVHFLPAVAAAGTGVIPGNAAPTAPEIAAGTRLDTQLNEINGFKFKNQTIDAPVLAESFTRKIAGEDTVDDSSMMFLDDTASNAIRTALAKGTTGYIVWMPYGNVATKRCEVWHVQSTGANDEINVDNTAARFEVTFAVLRGPGQNGALP